jgi:alkylation response protein AidB-like acyl-CoA dehydrogenase
MRQRGVEIRAIVQLTGTSEFNEVFFDDARAAAADIVGAPGDGWRVAMGTLGVERGVSTFGQQLAFQREFETVLATARATGAIDDPDLAARIIEAWAGLQVMRYTALATLRPQPGRPPGTEANVSKLIWAPWHQRLGELAVDVAGPARRPPSPDRATTSTTSSGCSCSPGPTPSTAAPARSSAMIAERALGLPREPR